MSDGQFGLAVALLFLLFGGIMVVIPHRMLAVLHRYNDGKVWTNNALYRNLVRPRIYITGMRSMGWVAILIGMALIVGLWLSRSQR